MIDKQSVFGRVSKIAFLVICLIVTIFPLYWIVVTSLKAPGTIYSLPLKYWPTELSFENYIGLFTKSDFGRYMMNSLIVATVASDSSSPAAAQSWPHSC